jgi:hypothetical protein
VSRRSKADNDELQELKRENTELKRKLARLRKRLQKFGDGDEEESEEAPPAIVAPAPSNTGYKCKCGCTEFRDFATPRFMIRICAACQARTRVV